ncbi:hypothetical protein [Natronococcus wangiae]|uniref:hypothetical protein n=1 Tax=Natronococcus wangiae TaxID=3068275 RepID=UPI00273FD188|nr:hypothetical protein [Natronococcus sp. AD5]
MTERSEVVAPGRTGRVVEGKGWEAVALTDRVVENMIMKRADTERHDDEILGSVASWI